MKKVIMMLMVVTVLLGACGTMGVAPQSSERYSEPAFAGGAEDGYYEPAPVAPAYDSEKAIASTAVENSLPQQRLVIENADMSVVVKDPQASLDAISSMAERLGGFVVSSNIYETYLGNGSKAPEGSITIRVPSENLSDALAEIKEGVVDVTSENRSGQDVTQEYTDLSSRLKNLENTERQLTLILEKAEKTEDVMLVFNQLTSIREQIEVIKGQMKYYEQSAALSAISIRLIAEETLQPIEIGGWKPEGVVRDAVQALVDFLKGFFEFVVWLVIVFLPAGVLILLVVGLALFVLWRVARWLWKRLFKNKKPAQPASPAETQK